MRAPATALSLRLLRGEGYTVDVVERWLSGVGARKDFLGLVDIIGVRGHETIAVQTTSASNFNARLNKMRDDEHRDALAALIEASWQVVIHGWCKHDKSGHVCTHGKARCACRWQLHRCVTLTESNSLR